MNKLPSSSSLDMPIALWRRPAPCTSAVRAASPLSEEILGRVLRSSRTLGRSPQAAAENPLRINPSGVPAVEHLCVCLAAVASTQTGSLRIGGFLEQEARPGPIPPISAARTGCEGARRFDICPLEVHGFGAGVMRYVAPPIGLFGDAWSIPLPPTTSAPPPWRPAAGIPAFPIDWEESRSHRCPPTRRQSCLCGGRIGPFWLCDFRALRPFAPWLPRRPSGDGS